MHCITRIYVGPIAVGARVFGRNHIYYKTQYKGMLEIANVSNFLTHMPTANIHIIMSFDVLCIVKNKNNSILSTPT